MFGYVVANIDALSAPDKERYSSVYCGLCHALGQAHGQLGRLTLTYDMSFLIILLSSLDKTEFSETKSFRCALHPMQKRLAFTNKHTRYAADMNILLAYYQKMDDWHDDKKTTALMQAKVLGKKISALEEAYPRQTKAIKEGLEALTLMERDGETNPDLPAAAFGGILAEIFTPQDHPQQDKLRAFGDCLGRFIYLMDAAVDLKKDIQHEKYNPLIAIPTQRHEDILKLLMADCAALFSALPLLRDKDLMENILYSGVWTRFPRHQQGENKA